jgi:hypothetical protein
MFKTSRITLKKFGFGHLKLGPRPKGEESKGQF